MNYEIKTTTEFFNWMLNLKDQKSLARIILRIKRIEKGVFGDCKVINKDISELRFFFGGGFRVYYTIKNNEIVLLLKGGTKDTQNKDIKKAQKLFNELE